MNKNRTKASVAGISQAMGSMSLESAPPSPSSSARVEPTTPIKGILKIPRTPRTEHKAVSFAEKASLRPFYKEDSPSTLARGKLFAPGEETNEYETSRKRAGIAVPSEKKWIPGREDLWSE
jgi:hypothetical protein